MKTNSKKRLNGEGIENSTRDLDLEGIVGNMLISQYQLQILRSKLADSLDGWWRLSQDRGRNSSSFRCDHHGQVFKVSLNVTSDDDEKNQQS
jgi:hypothetical protein